MREDYKKFLILYFECFIILIFMGYILPHIFEVILNGFYINPELYDNSLSVSAKVTPLTVLYRYVYVFKLILR